MSQRRYAANHYHRAAGSHPASCDAQLAIVSRRRLHVARRTSHHCAQGYGQTTVSDVADCTSHVARRIIVPRAMDWAVALHANLRAAIREPQSASCGPVASRSSQIAARSIEARHVLRHDCSSHGTARSSQTVAQAVLILRSQRAPRSSQGADFCAGGPRLTLFSSRRIADRTVADRSTLVRRSRLTLFSSRRIADRTVADRSTLARRSRQRSTVVRTLAVRWSQGAGV